MGIELRQLQAGRETCCDGERRWCEVCGGKGYRHLRGVAQCNGALWAEAYREAMRGHPDPLPETFPGTIEHAYHRMRIAAGNRYRLRAWLAGWCLAEARARWTRLIE